MNIPLFSKWKEKGLGLPSFRKHKNTIKLVCILYAIYFKAFWSCTIDLCDELSDNHWWYSLQWAVTDMTGSFTQWVEMENQISLIWEWITRLVWWTGSAHALKIFDSVCQCDSNQKKNSLFSILMILHSWFTTKTLTALSSIDSVIIHTYLVQNQ